MLQFHTDQNPADAALAGIKHVDVYLVKRSALVPHYRVIHQDRMPVDAQLAGRMLTWCNEMAGPGEYLLQVLDPNSGAMVMVCELDLHAPLDAIDSKQAMPRVSVVLYLPRR